MGDMGKGEITSFSSFGHRAKKIDDVFVRPCTFSTRLVVFERKKKFLWFYGCRSSRAAKAGTTVAHLSNRVRPICGEKIDNITFTTNRLHKATFNFNFPYQYVQV